MPSIFPTVLVSLAGLLMLMCKPAHSTLKLNQLPNYNSQSKDHILFLNLLFTRKAGGQERVRLLSAHAGDGRMKHIPSQVHSPYRVVAIPRYASGAIGREMVLEHPLAHASEVSDPSGQIQKVEIRDQEAPLVIRMQQEPGINRLELFSVTPEKGTAKIFTLHFE